MIIGIKPCLSLTGVSRRNVFFIYLHAIAVGKFLTHFLIDETIVILKTRGFCSTAVLSGAALP